LLIIANNNSSVARLFGSPSITPQQTSKLAEDPDFIAAIQSQLETGSIESTADAAALKGDKGDKGDTGATGNRGQAGTSGNAGSNGVDGIAGQSGLQGPQGEKGEIGARGPQGAMGAAGAAGQNGQDGADGTSYDISGNGLEVINNVLGLELDGSTLTTSANGLRVSAALSDQWDLAYTWGDHASAGYAKLNGQSGGQTLIGGTAANNALSLQANSATSGNTATATAIQFKVGNSGATTALSIFNNGNIGIGTTASYGKVNLNGVMVTTSEGDIFGQHDSSSNATYPVFDRYNDTSDSDFDGGTFLFGNGSNAWVGLEKPGGGNLARFRVRAVNSSFSGNVGITTDGSNQIVPFQFAQVTGLGDNPSITSFGGSTYSTSDWNPAVVGFATGGTCSSNWSNGTLTGFQYWWEANEGNWQLRIDMSGPNDGCNNVQVMFVRKEFSSRNGYGF
jgi:hypothetical protein